MTISAISSNNSTYQTDITAKLSQRKQDLQNLASALQSGNLATAQQAFALLQKDAPNINQSQNNQSSSQSSGQTTPLQALASALQNGDLSGAQQAFSQLQQNMKAHHHHHKGSGSSQTNSASSVTGVTGTGESTTSSTGQISVTA